ncbi:MAG: radical SAM protein [Caldiserica bacterium]|jgi:NifB/MoaA-like Fe-S oxidoreductase|nr:radical SAM protein [Caldisericota bacterium]MDH7561976.1 radical SAM protein [Caldisericota bacterium]
MREFPPEFLREIFKALSRKSVLPLGSPCNLSCYFCSSRNNPPGLRVFNFPFLPRNLIRDLIPLINPGEKIIIGESATRINEGEPLLHPDFLSIIKDLREAFPRTLIQITTNGALLTPEIQDRLSSLNPVELIISFNSFNPNLRAQFLGDSSPQRTVENFSYLSHSGIKFQGSFLLAPPFLPELSQSLERVEELGGYFVRLLLPGGSRMAHPDLQMSVKEWLHLKKKVDDLRALRKIPLVVEPPLIFDLQAEVEGVISGSPAQKSGFKPGDIIEKVDESRPRSRLEAFSLINDGENPLVIFRRQDHHLKLKIPKKAGEKSGLVFLQDFDFQKIQSLSSFLPQRGRGACFTGELAFEVVRLVFQGVFPEIPVIKVPNLSFGGSIRALGLLGVNDIRLVLKSLQDQGKKPDWVVLNPIFLDDYLDLWGEGIGELEDEFHLSLIFVP